MKSHIKSLATAAALLAAFAACCTRASAANRQASLPRFLDELAAIANARNAPALQRLSAPGIQQDTSWMLGQSAVPPSAMGKNVAWSARVITLDNGSQDPPRLVVVTEYHPCETQGDHVWLLDATPAGFRLGHEFLEGDRTGYRLIHHSMAITINPDAASLKADDTVDVVANKPVTPLPLDGLVLMHIQDGYNVDSAGQNGKPIWFAQAGGVLVVRLAAPPPASVAAPNDRPTAQIQLTWEGRAIQNRLDFIHPDEACISGYWMPQVGRLPVTADVTVNVPAGYSALTQGVLTRKVATNGGEAFYFENHLPVSVYSLDVARYLRITAPPAAGRPFTVNVDYLHAGDRALAERSLQTAIHALTFYNANFAPFPYPAYSVVISDRFAESLEGYSMTTVGRGDAPTVLPHEISHTWWGGIVPCTYLHDIWNEAMATYSDGLFERMNHSTEGMQQQTEPSILGSGMLENTGSVALGNSHDPLDVTQDIVGYFKGAAVMETLEGMIGQPAAIRVLQQIVKQHVPYEAATWQNVVQATATVAGQQWRSFFGAWLSGNTLPQLRLADVKVERNADGSATVNAAVVQSSDPPYWLKTPVQLRTSSATLTANAMVKSGSTPVTFSLPPGATPISLTIDPNHVALHGGASGAPLPSVTEFLADTGTLWAVYGTHGTPQENAAMRAAATAASEVFLEARVRPISDEAMLAQRHASGNILLIGGPTDNALVRVAATVFSVRFHLGVPPSLIVGESVSSDPAAWCFTTGPTGPFGAGRQAALFAALSPAGYESIGAIRALPGAASTYLAKGAGPLKLLAAVSRQSGNTGTYRFAHP
ncbi:MAG: hypothetical protein KGJ62_04445 [Armatimonadetes bacterium]|nr:hypothetical protein [Armatimonadota bacterium]MDE2207042.1 hypothetical protein [Armatimonadota bacterium]